MKISDFIDEHNRIGTVNFPAPILANGQDIAKIPLDSNYTADVYQITDQFGNIMLIAHNDNNIIGFIGLLKIPNRPAMFMVKNAKSYMRGKKLTLNLMLFARHYFDIALISDYEVSIDGEHSLLSMVKNTANGFKIYNFDQDKIYDLDDPAVIKPEHDNNSDPNKINWFYILKETIRFPIAKSIISPYYV